MKALIGHTQAEFTLILRDKTVLFFSLLFPVITVAFFGYLNQGNQVPLLGRTREVEVSYASFLIAGGIGMVISSAAFQNLSVALARQRDIGILKRLGGTPLRVKTLVSAKVLVAALLILVQTLIMITMNILLFNAEISGNPFWALVILVLGVVTFSTMGIALAGVCRNADIASAAGLAIALPMQFLCGTLFPLESMPQVLRRLAQALPLTYFVNALRGALLTGGGPIEYAWDWFILIMCWTIASLVAIKTFRWE
jgi:ABC-2 type transport system permease protein